MALTSDRHKVSGVTEKAAGGAVPDEFGGLRKRELVQLLQGVIGVLHLDDDSGNGFTTLLEAARSGTEARNCVIIELDRRNDHATILATLEKMKVGRISGATSFITRNLADSMGQVVEFSPAAANRSPLAGYVIYPLDPPPADPRGSDDDTRLYLGVLPRDGLPADHDRFLHLLAGTSGEIRKRQQAWRAAGQEVDALRQRCLDRDLEFQRLGETAEKLKNAVEEWRNRTIELSRVRDQLQRSNTDLTETNARLREMDKLKSNFLAVASHELRTPISIIKGYNKMLLDETTGSINSVQRQFLTECKDGCNRLIKMINSMLDLSKIEAGKMEMNFQAADLGQCSARVVRQMIPIAAREQITLESIAEPMMPELMFDQEKIDRVLMNLLENAIKFTSSGGKVVVSVGRYRGVRDGSRPPADREMVREGRFAAGTDARPEFLEVIVADTGIGIRDEEQEAVFKEFSQVSSSSRLFKGTGLGLAIAKRIVEAHGGEIWVKSEPDVGSEFHFILPVEKSAGRMTGPA